MSQPLKILIVEHRQEEAELLVQGLRGAGFEPDGRRVETEAEYREELKHCVELVLAGDQTPQLSGLRALELLQQCGLELPFILISATPGEALAVAAMKRGATDYLLQGDLARLGGAVIQAMAETRQRRERSRTEQRLRESVAGLALAQEVGNFGSWEIDLAPSTDPNRNPLRWSDQCFRIFGFAPGEVEVTNDLFFSLVHPDDHQAVWRAVSAAIEHRQRYLLNHRIVLRSGEVRQVREAAQVIFDEVTGQPLKMVGSVHDITESVAAEAALREKTTLIRIAGRVTRTGGWAVELPGRQLFWSDEMFEILEYPPGPAPNLAEALALYDEPWRSRIVALLDACAQDGTPFDVEVQIRTARGRTIWIRACGEAERRSDGSMLRLQGAFQDITEQKRAAAELDEKRAFFETLAANSVLGILVVDQAGRKVFQNRRMVELWNIPEAFASDPDDTNQFEFVASRTNDPAQFAARVRHLYAHPEASSQDEIEAIDGTVMDRHSAPVMSADGRNFGRIWSFHDITEQKRTEQKLRENERFVRAALDGLTAHIAILDGQGVILAVNEAWRAFAQDNDLSWDRGGEGVNYLQVCDRVRGAGAEDAGPVAAAIRALLKGEKTTYEAEYPCHSPSEKRWFLVRLTLFPGDGPRRVVVAHENITRRRLQEEELRNSEERFRQVVENIREVFWIRDVVQNRIIYVSEGYEKIWGLPRARLYESPLHWAESIFPADRDE
ncbi:MAG TPA: PAS domain-containing protein, partial [Candidatus Limnocylindria bacterium]|nr:PAS domain-containing protein [Candidatus Limnocylindria bacterium]